MRAGRPITGAKSGFTTLLPDRGLTVTWANARKHQDQVTLDLKIRLN
jgi:hypothetical protein